MVIDSVILRFNISLFETNYWRELHVHAWVERMFGRGCAMPARAGQLIISYFALEIQISSVC